jgi:hypothetical protein
MPVRKYFTEFAINMVGTAAILQQDALNDPELMKKLPPDLSYHIYMITRRPRIAFDPSSLKLTDDSFSGVFTIQRGSTFDRQSFGAHHDFGAGVQLRCDYPHTEFSISDKRGRFIAGGKVPLFLSQMSRQISPIMDLEVLYVGQSYGENGSRIAPDRLLSHATLQGIYAEAIRRAPDQEIWLLLFHFEPLLITSFDGRSKRYQTSPKQDRAHRDKVFKFEITEQQQINFTEAALIRYFRPEYNTMFKETFPNPAHATYSQCYDLDIHTVNVEIQAEDIMCRIWSPTVKPNWLHFAAFQLHSREERKGMFEI